MDLLVFTNDYYFTEEEKELEISKYNELKTAHELKKHEDIDELQTQIIKIQKILILDPLINGYNPEFISKIIKR